MQILEQEHYLEVFFVERYKYVCKGMLDYREILTVGGVHYWRSHCI